ncbi:MAG: HEPN domain-containing protein [Candidatus Cloacimonetes bacterium]|nr:HEPN domain-containing protein [Candidatus Cloacimonadota bacterium]
MTEDYEKLAQRWFERADDTLLYAQAGFAETGIAADTCFFAQQVVEKYLKGFLTYCGIESERTHSLPKLLKKAAEVSASLHQLQEVCSKLNDYYIEPRYPPDEPGVYSEKEAKQALEDAKETIHVIRKALKSIKPGQAKKETFEEEPELLRLIAEGAD